MHNLGSGLLAAFAASICVQLQAAEDTFFNFNDFRLDVGAVPVSRPVNNAIYQNGNNVSITESLPSLGLGLRVDLAMYKAIMPMTPAGTVVVGLDLFNAQQSGDPTPTQRQGVLLGPIKLNALGVDLSIAYAIAISQNVHFEIGPFAGVGTAAIEDRDVDANNPNVSDKAVGHGGYREIGARLWLIYTSRSNNFQCHLAIAYYGAHASATVMFNTAIGTLNDRITIDESGISPSIGFGYRF